MDSFPVFFFGIMLAGAFTFFVGTVAENQGFEAGQIAALSGDVQYHLVTNDVKEIVWKKINAK